jgi:hypothetical protein
VPDDYLSEADLAGLDLTPDLVAARFPWAAELTALDGTRCWAAADLGADDGGDA